MVQADGGLRRGPGAAATSHPSGGVCEVTFTRDVTGCAWTATIADAGDDAFAFAPP